MNNSEWNNWASGAGRMLLVYALIMSQCAWAGQNQDAKMKAESPQKASDQSVERQSPASTIAKSQADKAQTEISEAAEAGEKVSGDGSREGIKVHGHWTIEVRNPDGSLVMHREFENSLTGGGNYALSTVFARTNSVGLWQINLRGGCPGSIAVNDCIVEENASPQTGAGVFKGLIISTPATTGGLSTLQLTGTARTSAAGQITAVQTFINVCPGGGCAPATSGGYVTAGYLFSQAIITPISVASGQSIDVTVLFSFS